jgi:hypothetical protein
MRAARQRKQPRRRSPPPVIIALIAILIVFIASAQPQATHHVRAHSTARREPGVAVRIRPIRIVNVVFIV